MKQKFKNTKGITLVALIITIIVLLILAVVAITSISNSNIINNAKNAGAAYTEAEEKEKVTLAVHEAMLVGKGTISETTIVSGMNAQFTNNGWEKVSSDADTITVKIKVSQRQYKITLKTGAIELVTGESSGGNDPIPEPTDVISKTTSFVGYYADIEGDGVVDGVIYADKAIGNKGSGNSMGIEYTVETVNTGLKNYYISKKNYTGYFGTKDVISPKKDTGTERFYVMSLEDVGKESGATYCWYKSAISDTSGSMNDYENTTSIDFGTGKTNTEKMISKWKLNEYGAQNQDETHKDVWGQIITEAENGWFIPSKVEWLAFVGELGIDKKNYADYGMSNFYWSSSQGSNSNAWFINLNFEFIYSNGVDADAYVRLSKIF